MIIIIFFKHYFMPYVKYNIKEHFFKTKNFDPFKIISIVFVVVFMFVFSKGIEVLNSNNSYDIKYDGPDKTPLEKWLPFTKKKKD